MNKERESFITNTHRIIDCKNYFNIIKIRIFGNSAYSLYYLRSDIIENDTLKTKNLNECAIFCKLKGKWEIELLHSSLFVK